MARGDAELVAPALLHRIAIHIERTEFADLQIANPLLDLLTVREEKGRIDGLTVTIIGDVAHSRVARSDIYAFRKMGAEVRVAAPPTMLPADVESHGVKGFTSLR